MRKTVQTLAMLLSFAVSLNANELTKEQKEKLNSPIVKVKTNEYVIEEYNYINFIEKVKFGKFESDKIIIKILSTMNKNIINKENFIAYSASISDQMINSIFLTPEYANKIKSSGMPIKKPEKANLHIKLNFTQKGIEASLGSEHMVYMANFVSYSQIFDYEIKK